MQTTLPVVTNSIGKIYAILVEQIAKGETPDLKPANTRVLQKLRARCRCAQKVSNC